jgi:hypothetical protein
MKSQDALDQGRPRQKFSKKQKAEYAREKHMEALLEPPKLGLASFLVNPALLPKKPPPRKAVSDD